MKELDGGYPVLEIRANVQLIHAAAHVELHSMFELQAIAILLGRPIIRSDNRTGNGYFVFDGSTAYMYYDKFTS